MNTPTQITLSNSLVNNLTSNAPKHNLTSLPGEMLAAKNIQFSKESITLDVLINKHWQTLRLGITTAPKNLDKIASASIQLSNEGKSLTITPNNTRLTLNQPVQLQQFLNYINTGSELQNNPMPAQVVLTPTPKLVIEKLNASIAINKEVAQLLAAEQPLKIIISTNNKGAQLDVINRFAESVHTQPITQAKLASLLAQNLPNAQLQATPKFAILTHAQQAGSFKLNINNNQLNQLSHTVTNVNLSSQANKLLIQTNINSTTVILKNSFTKPFNQLTSAQQSSVSTSNLNNPTSPLIAANNSPIDSWLKSSFGELKTRISDAVKYFENKPFAAINQTTTGINKLNVAEQLNQQPNQLPPLVQLTQLIKSSVSLWQLPTSMLFATTSNGKLSSQNQLHPLEAKLLAPLLNQLSAASAINTPNNTPLLSSKIADIAQQLSQQPADLTRLVNQAFNRMVSSNNLHPTTIQREILATLQPTQLTNDTLQSSFSKGLEQLAVSILAAPIISQTTTPISINNQTGLDALLQVLLPTFKTGNSGAKLLEQLQQSQVQALAGELTQVKNTLGQVNVTPANQLADSNPLVNFLLPMKLPPEAAQTEITLGQYKKPSGDKLAEKNVWFVRLNFDYAQLGQLQITAELMDKALDCQLFASSQEVTAMAHPHLDNLRSKLAKHGLQVGDLTLKQGDASHQAFYKSHAIINIKV
ncbi:flagellar hook-length control protein FliK [Pseudoalteromonas sp. MIP2626]|uniref:flagellar hook-length control protein FliK n=1 Tax=Pseudoalteromonas sp. MIP2626 TaxID=2705464 RepID=UPI0015CBEC9C|nr:flagellar hook-length control protein FliK [Pseudoalteromonas sp. MIP2626]NYR11895.1 flagellar hook-length control protein FliK [Pseudoalteromonas sp. MIP2626]